MFIKMICKPLKFKKMKKNFSLLLVFCAFTFSLFYVSCNNNDELINPQNVHYDLSVEDDRITYLNEIKNTLVSDYNWMPVSELLQPRSHHCPQEISADELCETFTGPVPVYLDENFCNSLGIPYNPGCYVQGNFEITFCITVEGVEISWVPEGASFSSSNCPELFQYLFTLSPNQLWQTIGAIFDYGDANYEAAFFDQWVGNQPDRFDCNNTKAYVLESDGWSSKCEGSCIFWNTETNEIENKTIACGDGCCATVTTWCWDSEEQEVVSTPGVNLFIDGECSFTPNERCDGWLRNCEESDNCN